VLIGEFKAMLIDKMNTAAEKYNMFKEQDSVCVALSGGADSVAALIALAELGVKVNALHVNHGLRGEESERDEQFCRELCRKLNIPFTVKSVNVSEYAKQNKLGIEEAARILRYKAFEEAGADKICTAHTANDNAETVIFNLCRGTGMKGLAGIPPKRGNIIRPLILCSREEVEEYLEQKGQSYVNDSTNLTEAYARNKIRRSVMPVLKEINSGFLNNISKLSEILETEDDYLEIMAEKYSESDLSKINPALRRRVIINKFKKSGVKFNFEAVRAAERLIVSKGRERVNIQKNTYINAIGGFLNISHDIGSKRVLFAPVAVHIAKGEAFNPNTAASEGKNLFLGDKIVIIKLKNYKNIRQTQNIHENLTNNALDYDKIQGDVFLRNRRDGDKYTRVGRDFNSSIKKLLNKSVPRDERDFYAILCDEAGIIWVEGFGIADRVRADAGTKTIMDIEVSPQICRK